LHLVCDVAFQNWRNETSVHETLRDLIFMKLQRVSDVAGIPLDQVEWLAFWSHGILLLPYAVKDSARKPNPVTVRISRNLLERVRDLLCLLDSGNSFRRLRLERLDEIRN